LLACPNDPDDVKPLSEVTGTKIDEVFIGSCMTNIGHFRAAARLLNKTDGIPTRLWISPPTKMDEHQLREEGIYNIFAAAGARTEMPGCSLCMGNQARIAPKSTCVSTSTRNFPNRLGDGANVYLASAELAAIASILGRLPTVAEYLEHMQELDTMASEIYRYLNFDQIEAFQKSADTAVIPAVNIVNVA
jgi:aconitate hydratase 2/2-methylisocitrate dehydratase